MTVRKLLAAVISVVLLAGCGAVGESRCRADDGQVLVHTLTGNKWCDLPPHIQADEDGNISIFDRGANDYLID